MKKLLAVGVIVLFLGLAIAPSTGNIVSNDDTTPPVTTCTLDPPEPDGENGWYVNDVNVTLNATDDGSGVNATYYRINNGAWYIYTEPFIRKYEGNYVIEFYSVDNAGNEEERKSVELFIDKTRPEVIIGLNESGEDIFITTEAEDWESGMNRVEFYYFDNLQETVYGLGPDYQWKWNETNFSGYKKYDVCGFIFNPHLSNQNVTFFAIIVIISDYSFVSPLITHVVGYDTAGNWDEDYFDFPSSFVFPKIYFFQQVTLPEYYDGYLGKFFVNAWFRTWE